MRESTIGSEGGEVLLATIDSGTFVLDILHIYRDRPRLGGKIATVDVHCTGSVTKTGKLSTSLTSTWTLA